MRLSLLGFWLISAAITFAQLAPRTPQAGYEGQNVTAVSLLANPHRDLAPFFPLVTQGSNTPYSQEKIRASADALKKAGNFKEVRVEVVPDITGLRVSFLLEPSFYLGILQFPGAVKRFSYIRLLQVANLSDEDPYDPSRITVAENSLRELPEQKRIFSGDRACRYRNR